MIVKTIWDIWMNDWKLSLYCKWTLLEGIGGEEVKKYMDGTDSINYMKYCGEDDPILRKNIKNEAIALQYVNNIRDDVPEINELVKDFVKK